MSAFRATLSTADDTLPLLASERDGLCFAVFNAVDLPTWAGADYARLAYQTIAASPAMLRRFDFEAILSSENLVVFFLCEDTFLAGAYAQPEYRDGKRVLVHRGYVSSGKQRGLARVMIAALHVADTYRSGIPADGEAVARALSDGTINEASSTPFADAGFHGVRNFVAPVGPADVHLVPYATRWPEGYWIGSHLMTGKAEKIAARAADILADWPLIWGPKQRGEPAEVDIPF